jgi:hypothetical protein
MQKDQAGIERPTVGRISTVHGTRVFPTCSPSLITPTHFTMESFSDGPSRQNPLEFTLHSSSPNDMRLHLQNLLDGKEKQLQQAAALGERLLAQRVELEERVRLLQEIDADKSDEITADMRERYRELADAVRAWEFGNVQLTSAFTSSVRISVLYTVLSLTKTSEIRLPFRASLIVCFLFHRGD